MTSRASTYTDSMLSDFSSALLGEGADDQDMEEVIVNISSRDYGSPDNSNLSSVLSQIQDDGPAYGKSVKQEQRYSQAANTDYRNDAAPVEQSNDVFNSHAGAEQQPSPFSTNELHLGKTSNRSIWLQLTMTLVITVTAGLIMVELDARTSNLEQALNVYDIDLQESITAQGDDLLPEIKKINGALKSVQQDLQIVQTDYSGLGKRYEEAIENNLSTKAGEVVSIKNNVRVLENEILVLTEELEIVKSKLIATKENTRLNNKTTASSTISSSTGLIVNLASLSNAEKAESLVKKLYAAGLSPSIQNTVVKDKRVYRVSVSGFSDEKEAKLFIQNAEKQYGMKDGWIRKS